MPNQLSFDNLDLCFVPKPVLQDRTWRRCIELALRSRSENQRYGALVVAGGKFVGEGWNRLLGRSESFPFPTTFFLHAERASIGNAISSHGWEGLGGSTVFVAGLLVREKRPLIRRASMVNMGSCAQCARLYTRFGLSVCLMSENGWVKLTGEQSLKNALRNEEALRSSGMTKREFRRRICL